MAARRKRRARVDHDLVNDDLAPLELAWYVEQAHGVPAKFVEAVEVKETHDGKTVWEGAVKVFSLNGHPSGATRAYAWTYPKANGKRQLVAILGVSPVDTPAMAVRTAILAQVREAERVQN
jgi:hypothetical protein